MSDRTDTVQQHTNRGSALRATPKLSPAAAEQRQMDEYLRRARLARGVRA